MSSESPNFENRSRSISDEYIETYYSMPEPTYHKNNLKHQLVYAGETAPTTTARFPNPIATAMDNGKSKIQHIHSTTEQLNHQKGCSGTNCTNRNHARLSRDEQTPEKRNNQHHRNRSTKPYDESRANLRSKTPHI